MASFTAEKQKERLELLAACVQDGWPVTEIMDTYGISQQSIQKYHPGYSGMSLEDRAIVTGLKLKLRHMLKKRGLLRVGERL